MSDESKAWILTSQGIKFYLLRPTVEMVKIEDIAKALSQQCRWTGHTKFHYSVAQHCWYCSHLVPPHLQLAALLHDAGETYLGDMSRPLKHYTAAGEAYAKVEAVVEEIIFKKFGVLFPLPPEIKAADAQMLYAERAQLLTFASQTEYEFEKWGMPETQAPVDIHEWSPTEAEFMFLERYRELTKAA